MNHAHAADIPAAGTPFGAAHRVYLDTPPLKGLRLQPSWFHLEPYRKEKGCIVLRKQHGSGWNRA